MTKAQQVVSVSGYGSSGGSAGRDLLKNFATTLCFPTEFRFPRERNGLFDLMNSLERSTSPENSDLAIRDFEWLAERYGRGGRIRHLKKAGGRWDEFTGGRFSQASAKFVDEITEFEYPIDWFYFDFAKPYLTYVTEQLGRKVFDSTFEKSARMPNYDSQVIEHAGQEFLASVISGFVEKYRKGKESLVVLHNFFASRGMHELESIKALVPGIRFVIVDRDPRDVFWSYRSNRYMPRNAGPVERAEAFIAFFRERRIDYSGTSADSAVLHLRFEEMVTHPLRATKNLSDFLEVNLDSSSRVSTFFDPTKSRNTIGQWREAKGEDLDALARIEMELRAFIRE